MSKNPMLSKKQQKIRATFLKALRPPNDLTLSQWAEDNRYLTKETSGEPGRWNNDRTPYLIEIMNCLSEYSPYKEVWFMKGSQIGGTEVGNNWIGYIIDHTPGPTMMLIESKEMAKDQSRIRLSPLIENSPSIKEKVENFKSRDTGNNLLMKQFPGGYIALTGYNVPGELRSKPIKYIFTDEIDKAGYSIGDEGDLLGLLRARQRNFAKSKLFAVSSPLNEGESHIEDGFKRGTQEYYNVPCPYCGKKQKLQWKNLRFDDLKDIHYKCCHCSGKIYNHHKTKMLAQGEWIAENPNPKKGTRSFHLSSLYSPVGWYSWEELVSDFLEAKKNPSKLKVFVNTVLGECWRQNAKKQSWEPIYNRRETYQKEQIPEKAYFITAGADVQGDRVEVELVAWGRNLESWSIQNYIFPGDTLKLSSECYIELRKILSRKYADPNGNEDYIRCLMIDSRHNTNTVYQFCSSFHPKRVIPIMGVDNSYDVLSRPKAIEITNSSGKKTKTGRYRYSLGVSVLKEEFFGFLQAKEGEWGYCHFPDYDAEYFKQLTAEEKRIEQDKKNKFKQTYKWVKTRERNEALDLRIYARAAAYFMGIDTWSEKQWDNVEKLIKKK